MKTLIPVYLPHVIYDLKENLDSFFYESFSLDVWIMAKESEKARYDQKTCYYYVSIRSAWRFKLRFINVVYYSVFEKYPKK